MKNKPVIIIRVDGGSDIPGDEDRKRGLGHIMRCIPLAKELKKIFCANAEIILIMKDHHKGVKLVTEAGFDVKKLPLGISKEEDNRLINDILKNTRPVAIVNDVLNTTSNYVFALKEMRIFVLNVDDLGPGREFADALVYSLVRPPICIVLKTQYPKPQIYSGPLYMTLKDDFSKMHDKNKPTRKKIKNVMITMGAGDPRALTLKVVSALEQVKGADNFSTTIVLGPAFTFDKELDKLLKSVKKRYTVLRNVANMPELMYKSDIAIISGGVSVYEIAAVGTPAISICQNEHELTNIYSDYGFTIKLGLGTQVSERQIADDFEQLAANQKLRREMSKRAKQMVDGRGAERVAKIIINGIKSRGYAHKFEPPRAKVTK